MKTCKRCGLNKPITEFSRSGKIYKGKIYRRLVCNRCVHMVRRGYIKAYVLEHKKQVLEQRKKGQRKYAKNNPIKIKAHHIANQNKETIKKGKCEKCSETEDLHMHHPDYTRPDYVLTLCRTHHIGVHHYAEKL